jgi:hypothetical protein
MPHLSSLLGFALLSLGMVLAGLAIKMAFEVKRA